MNGLVFDCGTNETKALLYTYKQGSVCDIQMKEIKSKSGWRDGIVMHLIKGTDLSFLTEKFTELYLETCDMIGNKSKESALDFCIIGASSWARKFNGDTELSKRKNEFMQKLRNGGFWPVIFNQNEESHFELLATIFGFSIAQNVNMIPRYLTFGGVLASGGGSSQYTVFRGGSRRSSPYNSLNIEIGNREGTKLFVAEASSEKPEKALDVLDKWLLRTVR